MQLGQLVADSAPKLQGAQCAFCLPQCHSVGSVGADTVAAHHDNFVGVLTATSSAPARAAGTRRTARSDYICDRNGNHQTLIYDGIMEKKNGKYNGNYYFDCCKIAPQIVIGEAQARFEDQALSEQPPFWESLE